MEQKLQIEEKLQKRKWETPVVEVISSNNIENGYINTDFEDQPPFNTFRNTAPHS